MSRRIIVAAALSSLLAACNSAPSQDSAPSPTTAVLRSQWQCGDLRIQADFDTGNADRVTLAFDGQQLILPHAVAASGTRYADAAGNEFWTKGREGSLTIAGQSRRQCVRSDATSPWETAAARGIRFRAVGNEPGWLVEVGGGRTPQLRAQLDYGQRTLDLTASQIGPDHYRGAMDDGTAVDLTVQRRSCQDVMSGESFPATAVLRVGTNEYRGCGRHLPE